MWPFKSSRSARLIADALAPGVLPSAREKAMEALMALPQTPEMIDCYSRIALDVKQVWKTRYKALEGMKLSPNPDGARALLRSVKSDLRRLALANLCSSGMPDAVSQIGPEALAILIGARDEITAEAETAFRELLLNDLDSLRHLLERVTIPGAPSLLAEVNGLSARLRNRLVPKFLERALTSKYHREVKEALDDLERLATDEAQAALLKFRSTASRLVEKTVPPGIGSPDESCKRQVYTSEFGQPPCEAERALAAERLRDWERRHPEDKPKPAPVPTSPPETDSASPDPRWLDNFAAPAASTDSAPAAETAPTPEWPVASAQYYAAASARGMEEELLALVQDQLDFLKRLHQAGSLAPLAAAMDSRGEINGMALTTKDPDADDKEVDETIRFFRDALQTMARRGELLAGAIFYHGCHGLGRGAFTVAPAQTIVSADCLVALLDHVDGQSMTCVIQYTAGPDGWHYAPAYYAPKQPDVFVDLIGQPHAPNRAVASAYPRRPASAADLGTHPEMMTLVESQFEIVKRTHQAGSPAPVAACMKPSGEIQAALLLDAAAWNSRHVETDPRDPIVFYPAGENERTPAGAVPFFIAKHRAAASRGDIVASAIFYHGIYDPEVARAGIKPAEIGEAPDCVVVQLDHRLSQAISLVIRYSWDEQGNYTYALPEHHSTFPRIFNEA